MPTFLSKVFKSKDGSSVHSKSKKNTQQPLPDIVVKEQPQWQDAWTRKEVEPEEVQELLRGCTHEIKSRALDLPFLLLPFRPHSDQSGAKAFIRNYFGPDSTRGIQLHGEYLMQELRLTEPMILCSVMKWCWSRLPGGVVTWEAYELFRVGEEDSNMARDSFATFIPISVDSDSRTKIIFDFFDLMASIAAHAKTNGLGGRKLSRLAGWWAFEHKEDGTGFEGGYKSWASAADATSHLFFAYLRSLSPTSVRGTNGISALPISLQSLVQATEYPPATPTLMQTSTSKVVMIVDRVSPTPFSLLRRAKHFEYRDDDPSLQAFASYQDPINTLTEECRRVLMAISSTNQSTTMTSKASNGQPDASWSRFEDMGFSGMTDEPENEDEGRRSAAAKRRQLSEGLSSTPHSRMQDMGRPTTPSWADFLSSGFVDEPGTTGPAPLLLPPDKVLPPIDTDRVRSSQSHKRIADESNLEPGELASIGKLDLDDSFWWVWITSLAGEESISRKAVFGRCALIETSIQGARWLVIEEQVKGAAPAIEEGAYIVEKKSRFGLSKKSRLTRRKSTGKKLPIPDRDAPYRNTESLPMSKVSIGPDQHARIQAAAAALQQKQRQQDVGETVNTRRARNDESASKTNSVMTLQPVILNEASPAMKWAHKYDKDAIREAYLANTNLGKGAGDGASTNGSTREPVAALKRPQTPPQRGPSPKIQESPEAKPQRDIEKPPIMTTPPPIDAHPANGSKSVVEKPTSPPKSPGLRKPVPGPEPVQSTARTATPELNDLEREANASALAAQQQQPPTPEKVSVQPSSPGKERKLRKKDNRTGGFRKMFGKKKDEKPEPVVETNGHGPLHGEQPDPTKQPSTLTRRLSRLGKKDEASSVKSSRLHTPEPEREDQPMSTIPQSPGVTEKPAVAAVAPVEVEQHREPAPAPVVDHAPFEEHNRRFQNPDHHHSPVDTRDQRDADKAFSAFDQGPMPDMPAHAPRDDYDEDVTPVGASHEKLPSPEPVAPKVAPKAAAPIPKPLVTETAPVKPAKPAEEESAAQRETVQQQQDRWAQIRKHAAERAAARNGEEARTGEDASRPIDTAKTEDTETSGEETIESRVARIKARVAELTGNMDTPQVART